MLASTEIANAGPLAGIICKKGVRPVVLDPKYLNWTLKRWPKNFMNMQMEIGILKNYSVVL